MSSFREYLQQVLSFLESTSPNWAEVTLKFSRCSQIFMWSQVWDKLFDRVSEDKFMSFVHMTPGKADSHSHVTECFVSAVQEGDFRQDLVDVLRGFLAKVDAQAKLPDDPQVTAAVGVAHAADPAWQVLD
jgi:hypothetical protein